MVSVATEIEYLDQTGTVFTGADGNYIEEPFVLSALSNSQKEAIQRAKKYAMEQSIKSVMVRQTLVHKQQQQIVFQQNIQRQQALALMCRVYVGSINFDVSEQTLRQAFAPFGPMRSVSMPYDPFLHKFKGFAFVEYEIPESASLALDQMNNVVLGGRSVKVGRPSNMPAALSIINDIMLEALEYHRVFIASVHADLNDEDIRSVFEAFGSIKSCYLVKDPTKPSRHRGFGFIEYDMAKSAQDATMAMNMFDLGGQYLRVGRCVTPPTTALTLSQNPLTGLPTQAAVALAAVTAKITAADVTGATEMVGRKGFSALPPAGVVAQPAAPGPPGVVTSLQPSPLSAPQYSPFGVGEYASPSSIALGGAGYASPAAAAIGTAYGPVGASQVATPTFYPTSPAVASPANFPLTALPVPPPPPRPASDDATAEVALNDAVDIRIKGHESRAFVMQRLMRKQECKVMVLRNMVGPEDVDELLETEVSEECSKYGVVSKVIIYQERQGVEDTAETIVKIFVEFSNQTEVEKAISSLNSRYFGGRVVRADKYDMDLYIAQDLSG